jgi:transposase
MTTIQELTADLAPGARITGERRDQLAAAIVEKYQAGMTVRQLEAHFNRSYGFIHRVLTEQGVELRPRGGTNARRLQPDERQEYRQRLETLKRKRR